MEELSDSSPTNWTRLQKIFLDDLLDEQLQLLTLWFGFRDQRSGGCQLAHAPAKVDRAGGEIRETRDGGQRRLDALSEDHLDVQRLIVNTGLHSSLTLGPG